MFDVFISNDGPMVKLVKGLKDVDALQYAINLHRSINVPHTIFVISEDKENALVTLSLSE